MKRILLIALFSGLVSVVCQGQYAFSTFTQAYTPLSNATPVDLQGDDLWDDPEFTVELGFDFQLNGTSNSSLLQLDLGAGLGNIGNNEGNIFGYFSDLINGAAIEGAATSTITYETSGTPGDRIFKLQYANAAFYSEVEGEGSADNLTNFQIWLYETDNAVEIHFGSSTISDPELVYEGFPGPQIGFFLGIPFDSFIPDYAYGLNGSPSNPTFGPIDIESFDFSLTGTPESGRVYRFVPSGTVSTENATDNPFSVFPTIATDVVNVKGVDGNPVYRIFDLTGKEVASGRLDQNARIRVNSLIDGLYLISIDGMNKSAKFFKK